MIQISKTQFEELDKAKLLKHTKDNKNYYIGNRQKSSRAKSYFVCEEYKIMKFLYPEQFEEKEKDTKTKQKFKPHKK